MDIEKVKRSLRLLPRLNSKMSAEKVGLAPLVHPKFDNSLLINDIQNFLPHLNPTYTPPIIKWIIDNG